MGEGLRTSTRVALYIVAFFMGSIIAAMVNQGVTFLFKGAAAQVQAQREMKQHQEQLKEVVTNMEDYLALLTDADSERVAIWTEIFAIQDHIGMHHEVQAPSSYGAMPGWGGLDLENELPPLPEPMPAPALPTRDFAPQQQIAPYQPVLEK